MTTIYAPITVQGDAVFITSSQTARSRLNGGCDITDSQFFIKDEKGNDLTDGKLIASENLGDFIKDLEVKIGQSKNIQLLEALLSLPEDTVTQEQPSTAPSMRR